MDTRKVEKRLEELQERLEAIERAIPFAWELASLSERLNIPLNLCHDQLRQLMVLNGLREKAPQIEKDDISRIIIQALLRKPEMNITGITAAVRTLRGKSSRRIVAERLERLEGLMIVEHRTGQNNEKVYRLRHAGR